MSKLMFTDFVKCFRKQFVFQEKGRYGKRRSKYYTANNQEQGLKNDKWGIMVFIYTGSYFGFNDNDLQDELKISIGLYLVLKDEVEEVLRRDYHDAALHRKVVNKIGLVKNSIRCHQSI